MPRATVAEPECGSDGSRVVVSDTLRALFRVSRRGNGAGAGSPIASEPDAAQNGPLVSEAPPRPAKPDAAAGKACGPAPSPAPHRPVRLRRDGSRPDRFRGSLIAAGNWRPEPGKGGATDQEVGVRFALYTRCNGTLVVEAATLVPDGAPLRSVHRVASVADRTALAGFLDRFDPAAGWSWLDLAEPESTEALARAALAERLKTALRRLAEAVTGAAGAQPLPGETA